MALTKPIAYSMAAFDATKSSIFYFTVESGDMVVKNTITIVDQSTNEIVYQDTTTDSYLIYNHTVPENTLTNGGYYYYYINTYNSNGDMSVNSNSVPFYCYTTPVIEITNLPDVIEITNFIYNITYSQAEREKLDNLIVTVYDSNNNVWAKSDKILANSDNIYTYTVFGLTNGDYAVEVQSTTVNNTITSTGYKEFKVELYQPLSFDKLTINNYCDKGYIEIGSHLVDIEGTSYDDPIYLKEDDKTEIYLLPRQRYVRWNSNIEIPSNFTLGLWGKLGEQYNNKSIAGQSLLTPVYNNGLVASNGQRVTWDNIIVYSDFTIGIWGQLSDGIGEKTLVSQLINDNYLMNFYLSNTDSICYIVEILNKSTNEVLCSGKSGYLAKVSYDETFCIFFQKVDDTMVLRLGISGGNEWVESVSTLFGSDRLPAEFGTKDYGVKTTELYWSANGSFTYGSISTISKLNSCFPFTVANIQNDTDKIITFDGFHISEDLTINYNDFDKLTNSSTIINCTFANNITGVSMSGDEIMTISNDNYRITLSPIYEIPYNETEPKSCINVTVTTSGNRKIASGRTNYVERLDPQDYYAFFMQKKGSDWSLSLTNFTETKDTFSWGKNSNIHSGQTILEVTYNNERDYGVGSIINNDFSTVLDSMFPFTDVKISNGIYDGISITKDTEITQADYLEYVPWDYNTILNCGFNDTILGGNVEDIVSHIGYIRLKRKAKDSNKWIVLKQIEVKTGSQDEMSFTFKDAYIPSGVTQQYALATVSPAGTESSYDIKEITPAWKFPCITIDGNTFAIHNQVNYNTITNNRSYGELIPIKSKYPIVIKNAETAYLSGSVSVDFIGVDYLKTRQLDRYQITKEVQHFRQLVDTGSSICIKDPNGKIVLCRPTSGDTESFTTNYGNVIPTVTINWVEQGKYDDQDDLYELGIIEQNIV